MPAWKVKWCQENLPYMIGKDDTGGHDMSKSMKSGLKKKKTMKKIGTKKMQKMKSMASTMKIEDSSEEEEEDDCNLE